MFHMVDGIWNHDILGGGAKINSTSLKKFAETGYRLLRFFSAVRIGITKMDAGPICGLFLLNTKNRNHHRSSSTNRKCKLTLKSIFTVRKEVAKVMFLHLSVILFTGGGEYLGRYPPGPGAPPPPGRYTPQDQVHPRTRYTPQAGTPWDQVHPPEPGTPFQTRYHPPDQVHPHPPLPSGRYTPQTRYTPTPRQVPPQDQVQPPGRYPLGPGSLPGPGTPPDQVHPHPPLPLAGTLPRPGTPPTPAATPPGPGTTPWQVHPRDQVQPPRQMATVADGTHRTGMQSC